MKKTTLALLICSTLSVTAWADEQVSSENAWEGTTHHAVIVKLKPTEELSRATGSLQLSDTSLSVSRLYQQDEMNRSAMTEMAELDKRYGFDRYLRIALPESKSRDSDYINSLINELKQNNDVELVYPEPEVVSLKLTPEDNQPQRNARSISEFASVPDFRDKQHYAKAPDDTQPGYVMGGVNRASADKYPGNDGTGVSLASVEPEPWNYNHINLPAVSFWGAQRPYIGDDHDTASVGIMAAKDIGSGIRGMAWNVRMGYSNSGKELYKIIPHLNAGDVVQIGVQTTDNKATDCTTNCFVPLESSPDWYSLIKAMTDKGVHVIEAAGNGNINLDHPGFNGKYNLATRDSGAIIAGAFCAKNGQKASFSTYGSRVTSSSWGCADVVSTGYSDLNGGQNTGYTAMFSGTSAANPIIAGVVASLSGIAKAHNIEVTPVQMREILHDTGTLLANGDSAKIGTHPNMEKAIARIMELKEDENAGKPVADAGKNFTVTGTAAGQGSRAYTLDGSASLNATSWEWSISKGKGNFWMQEKQGGQWYSTLSGPQIRALIPENTSGEVTYLLTVTGENKEKVTSEVTITVEKPQPIDNDPAFIAAVTLTVPSVDNGTSVTFNGTVASSISATSTPGYSWILPAGAQGSNQGQASQSFTLNKTAQPQTLEVQVTVTAGKQQKTLKHAITVPALEVPEVPVVPEVPEVPANAAPAYNPNIPYATACTRVMYNGQVYQNQWYANPGQEVPGSGGAWGAIWQAEKSENNRACLK